MKRFFKLEENKTNVRKEFMAGLTTFMTMAYILAVNPDILGTTGMPKGGVLIATALASALACACMAFFANLPFALAPGMGLNAYFAFVVVGKMGYSWQAALFAVFVEGIIFLLLSLTNVREAIFNAIPLSLKHSISAGIGLFIAFIGLQNSHLVVTSEATKVTIINFRDNINSAGIAAILCIIGVILIGVLHHKKVRGAVLIGILATWVLGMLAQAVGLYVPDPAAKMFSLYPTWSLPAFDEFGQIFGQALNFEAINFQSIGSFLVIIFAFLFVDIFDTLGTLIGVASKAEMLDKDGKLPRIKGALMADSVGTTVGAVFGTSTVTTYVESASGVTEGGRTGLTSLTTGVLFLVSIILSPIFISIPAFATGAALIYVGYLMLGSVLKVDFNDLTEAIPAFVTLIAMPFFFSIAEGITFGVITYVVINLFAGKLKEKKVSWLMYVLCVLFILKYIFL